MATDKMQESTFPPILTEGSSGSLWFIELLLSLTLLIPCIALHLLILITGDRTKYRVFIPPNSVCYTLCIALGLGGRVLPLTAGMLFFS